ncbi:CHRD domain-containing protein [Alicyclobacillus sp. SP_1]|jgi:hypothetical protein|uniref:CHRD domain-containing protein n=1 Tax=Alicyclobacillus sp. SP_1 TaxID=2942475 RepID=UPI002157C9C2|nr:CHRD domain-containing protein [Alicyclobacillus sp. SP_1]
MLKRILVALGCCTVATSSWLVESGWAAYASTATTSALPTKSSVEDAVHRPILYAVARIDPERGHHMHGTAELVWDEATQNLTVLVVAAGLRPMQRYLVHLHNFSKASRGPVLYPLQTLDANSQGEARSVTVLRHVPYIPDGGWYIAIHSGFNFDVTMESLASGNVYVLHPRPGEPISVP